MWIYELEMISDTLGKSEIFTKRQWTDIAIIQEMMTKLIDGNGRWYEVHKS